ncbi:hypothetical protein [Embleya sp. NPDC005575]|uniref:hypothetical protein n=1 Tax=Embleya sp. NPDC005575 TaxID=3156892 RepID=UPI0033B9C060
MGGDVVTGAGTARAIANADADEKAHDTTNGAGTMHGAAKAGGAARDTAYRAETPHDAVIEEYLDALVAALIGPRGRRRAILDEALDGLLECADAHAADCADPTEAARRAVAEWGPAAVVAGAYNEAVHRRGVRRLGATALGALPALAAVWCLAMLAGPAGPWERRPPAVNVGLVLLGFGCVFATAAALSGLRAGSGVRAVAPGATAPTRETAAAVSGVLLVLATLPAMVVNRGLVAPHSLAWPLIAPAITVNVGLALYLGTAWRRLRATTPTTAAAGRKDDPAWVDEAR